MQRARRRWRVFTVLVAGPLAALVILLSLDDRSTGSRVERFVVPDEFVGPVWVRVPDSDDTLTIHLEWGSWGAEWTVGPDAARSYRFGKGVTADGDINAPIAITVTPAVDFETGYGQLPTGTRAVPDDAWFLL